MRWDREGQDGPSALSLHAVGQGIPWVMVGKGLWQHLQPCAGLKENNQVPCTGIPAHHHLPPSLLAPDLVFRG